MTKRVDHDHDISGTLFLPFAPGELDRSGLRLTRSEFARFMDVSKQAVGEWVTSGKITLGVDGRLDPRQAVNQLLRNSDPARIRSRVLAPLVQNVGSLQKRIAEMETALAAAKEESEFHEGAALELAGQVNGLQRRLQKERMDMASLTGDQVAGAIIAWLIVASETGDVPDLGIRECLLLSDASLRDSTPPCAPAPTAEGRGAGDDLFQPCSDETERGTHDD